MVADRLEKGHASIQELIKYDEEYMKIETDYLREWTLLQRKYENMQKPILEKRQKFIENTGNEVKDFWLNVLQAHPIFAEEIRPHDEEVLSYLRELRVETIEDEFNQAGFKIIAEFDENEFFSNTSLVRVYETGRESEFLTEIGIKKIYMEEEIDWKVGKDVTIEMVKPKNKGNKKNANKKPEKQPRDSFFRTFFRTIDLEDAEELKDLMDKSLNEMGFDPQDCEDEEELEQAYEDALEKVNDDAYEMGMCLRDNIIPFAVRWYSGEAMPNIDEEEEGDEDAESDDEDADSDEEEVSSSKSPKGKKKDVTSAFDPTAQPGEKINKEECKQQ